MDVIQEYALALVAGLGSIGIIGTLVNLYKAFSQKALNRSFDVFKSSVNQIQSNSGALAVNVGQLKSTLDNLFKDLKTAITEIQELKEFIEILKSDSILTEIKEGLLGLDVVKQSIDMKDSLIETFGKEITKIKAELEKLNRKEK